jgi:hypothetical protein
LSKEINFSVKVDRKEENELQLIELEQKREMLKEQLIDIEKHFKLKGSIFSVNLINSNTKDINQDDELLKLTGRFQKKRDIFVEDILMKEAVIIKTVLKDQYLTVLTWQEDEAMISVIQSTGTEFTKYASFSLGYSFCSDFDFLDLETNLLFLASCSGEDTLLKSLEISKETKSVITEKSSKNVPFPISKLTLYMPDPKHIIFESFDEKSKFLNFGIFEKNSKSEDFSIDLLNSFQKCKKKFNPNS